MTKNEQPRPRCAASQKALPNRRQTSARGRDNTEKHKELFALLEEKLTGQRPLKPPQTLNELHERLGHYNLQKRIAWLRRPRIHIAIFEEVWNDEERAKEGFISFEATERARKVQELAKNLGWSDEHLLMFKQLVVEYRQRPSVENYLKVRHLFPDAEIQVDRLGGIDALFALEKDFEKQGVDPELIVAALEAEEPAIDALSLRLLECLAARDNIETGRPGYIERRRNAITDATVNYLIAMMLEALDRYGEMVQLPGSLIVLIRHQICSPAPDLKKAYLSKEKRLNAAFLAAQQLRPGEKVSVRKLSKMTGAPRMTAARWLADNEFKDLLEANRKRALDRLKRKAPE
jgi:hypothetical protein